MTEVKTAVDNELYSFTVDTEKEIEKQETKQEGDEKITVTKKVKEVVPVRIVIKKPNRRLNDEAEMHRAVKMSQCIKEGIVTKAMLTKKYADTGGVLSELEAKEYLSKYNRLMDLQVDWAKLSVTKKKEKGHAAKLKKLIGEMNTLRREVANTESAHADIFNNTADVFALKQEILFYTLMLSYIAEEDEEGNETLVPYFEGNTFSEKIDSYYEKEDNPSDFYIRVSTKLTYIITFWRNGAAMSKEDFEGVEKDIDEGNL